MRGVIKMTKQEIQKIFKQ